MNIESAPHPLSLWAVSGLSIVCWDVRPETVLKWYHWDARKLIYVSQDGDRLI